VVAAIDARRRPLPDEGWAVLTHGGRRTTGLDAVAWAEEVVRRGAGEILLTSMDRDGTRDGFDTTLVAAVAARVPVPVIASGGAGAAAHFVDAFHAGAEAALAATLFHYRELEIRAVKAACRAAELPVREA
jgi:imidazole glycerol-phosphate synthase subunit HisF